MIPIARVSQVIGCWIVLATAALTADVPTHEESPGIPKGEQATIQIGMFLLRVPSLSLPNNEFTIDAYVWFRWKGDLDPKPSESFEVTNGTVENKELCEEKVIKVNGEDIHYACCRITARISQYWDVSSYPFDRHILNVHIEDAKNDEAALQYEVDRGNCGIDESCRITGWTLGEPTAEIASHLYHTNYGDLELESGYVSRFSRFAFSFPMERASIAYSFKVFNGLHVAVVIALLAFCIKPTNLDPRFGLGIGAIFAAIASQYLIASQLPETGQLTLVDQLHIAGNLTILASLLISVASLTLFERGREAASRRVDRFALLALTLAYAGTCGWLSIHG